MTAFARNRPHTTGSTLVEVTVAIGFVAVLAALLYAFSQSCLRTIGAQQARADAQDPAHLALPLIARDLRQAGYSAAGPPILGIEDAEASRIALRCDLNGDGDFADPNERVAYGADAARGTLTRASGGAPPQPLVDHLLAGSLRFTYFDQAGGAVDPGAGSLDLEQREAVRRIDVAYVIAVPARDPHLPAPVQRGVATTVILRNVPPP